VRSGLHGRLALLEDLSAPISRPDHRTLAYVRHAEALVETALGRLRQRADPELGTSIRELREDADRRRREELDELLRGLPDLDADERRAIERFSTRLVASILHRPTLAVRDGR
jgi:glutamyl-tRNA reductase